MQALRGGQGAESAAGTAGGQAGTGDDVGIAPAEHLHVAAALIEQLLHLLADAVLPLGEVQGLDAQVLPLAEFLLQLHHLAIKDLHRGLVNQGFPTMAWAWLSQKRASSASVRG